jgi:hypothetical protein
VLNSWDKKAKPEGRIKLLDENCVFACGYDLCGCGESFSRGRKGIRTEVSQKHKAFTLNIPIIQTNTSKSNMNTPLPTFTPAADDHQEYDDDSSIATDASFSDDEDSFHNRLFESFVSFSEKVEQELTHPVVQRVQLRRTTRPRRHQTMQNEDVNERPCPVVVAVLGNDEEDSVVLLRSRGANRDPNYMSWSDKILDRMEGSDIVDAPLNDVARNGETTGSQQRHGNSNHCCKRLRSLNKRQVGRKSYPNE